MSEKLAFTYHGSLAVDREPVQAGAVHRAPARAAAVSRPERRDWAFLGLLLFTGALLARPQDQIPGLSWVHFAEFFAILGVGSMVIGRMNRRQSLLRVTPEMIGLVVFGAALLVSIPFSVWPGGAMNVFANAYLKVMVVFILMVSTLTTAKRVEQTTWVIVLCCGLIAAESVVSYAGGTRLVEGNRLNGPVGGIFGNPNDLAMNMVSFLPAAVVVALTRRYSTFRRLTAALITALMLGTIVFTKSRGGALGLLAMLGALIWFGRKVRPGFGLVAIVGLLAVTPFIPTAYWHRMMSITDDARDREEFTGSREARWNVMTEGFKTFIERPLTGVGAGQFPAYNPPGRKEPWNETHNALLQVAAETGIAGLLAFMYLIVRAFTATGLTRRLTRPVRRKTAANESPTEATDRRILHDHAVAQAAGLVGWFVCSVFASVAYSWTFYYLLALAVSSRDLARMYRGRTAPAHARRDATEPAADRSGAVVRYPWPYGGQHA